MPQRALGEEKAAQLQLDGSEQGFGDSLRKGYHMGTFDYKAAWPLYLLALIVGAGLGW